jgi:drug/metabolite transporter (DMT)-like permease
MRWLLLAVVVLSTVAGDILQSFAMRQEGRGSEKPPGLARVVWLIFRRSYLLLSVFSMAISFFAFLALVQTEPLSFAVPASAASFILETILARVILGERISLRRGTGALLVFAGILLISR